MGDLTPIQCGFCSNQFLVRPDQRGHEVRCPHCKIVTKIPQATDAAAEAVRAISDLIPHRDPVHDHRRPVRVGTGVRSRGLVVLWLVLLALALIGGIIGIAVVFFPRGGPSNVPVIGVAPAPSAPGASGKAAAVGVAALSPTGVPAPGSTVSGGQADRLKAPIELQVKRLIGGFKGETVTYAVGRVTNNTGATIRAIRIEVSIMDSEEKPLGEAQGILLNIPPGVTAPVVAEWVHEAGVRGTKWVPGYTLNPAGVPQDLPPITVNDAMPLRDPNSLSPTGKVSMRVTNHGAVPVSQTEVVAILVGSEGKIVGALKAVLDKTLPPNKPEELIAIWDLCACHLVSTVEAWAQPAR